MSEDITRFLDLEQQATDLTLELERLREETLNYSKAAKGLDAAITELGPTAAALLELVGKSREIIEAIGSIGTAQLLASTSDVKNDLDRFRQEMSVSTPQLLASTREVKDELDGFRQEVSGRLEQIEKYQRRSMFSKLFGGG